MFQARLRRAGLRLGRCRHFRGGYETRGAFRSHLRVLLARVPASRSAPRSHGNAITARRRRCLFPPPHEQADARLVRGVSRTRFYLF
jgi:hypothetical protein